MPSHYPGWATAAWFLSDGLASTTQSFYGVSSVVGSTNCIYAYCAELYGLYCLLVALEYFCQYHHITDGGITLGCDNQSAIHQVQRFQEQVPCHVSHADIL